MNTDQFLTNLNLHTYFFGNCKKGKFKIKAVSFFSFFYTNQNQSTNRSAGGHNSLVKYIFLFTGPENLAMNGATPYPSFGTFSNVSVE